MLARQCIWSRLNNYISILVRSAGVIKLTENMSLHCITISLHKALNGPSKAILEETNSADVNDDIIKAKKKS